ncbi:PREDICTED: beta-fructofuranosidase, insoluble isoenzyme CWINV1-like [Fragaria vesca subsp. vesca]|uniref:beta-fructofuranosidase, insoluble isoenzyme CWINV1-like n=1 Tax=Fragaria vesca subsp. vesca TaxID=101020 RepID=UPI0002C3098A|nr:PREDICTED: beta-fructofuranosidase, insoluble isoenzyme CWINV1-like [Fragaria vesca subsp. vesca]
MMIFSLWQFCLLSLLLSYGVIELQASHHVYSNLQTTQLTSTHPQAKDPYRTGYHFQPRKNWINDPNGPLIYKGIYHLFYQYNPSSVVWGNIVWAHSTSTDLVNWIPHEAAIYPSILSDINGCWSGSVTILPGGKPAILYTGINPDKEQVQNLAFPKNLSDPFLREWVKVPQNPLMAPTQANQINASSFRDPTTAWLGPDKRWRLIIGSKRNQRGLAILYRSKDFMHWTKAKHPLYSTPKNGMWECPDFFPVSKTKLLGLDTSAIGPDVKHVLKVSLDNTRKEYYTIGTYNVSKDIYIPDDGSIESDSGLRYDYGKFYASKTFFDSAKNRRILWGWINESSSVSGDIKKGWSGLQAIPRTIVLDKSGKQLVQWPVVELEKLRTKEVKLPSTLLKGGSLHEVIGVTAAQADVDVAFEISDLKKAEVTDPSWTNAQLLCSKKGTSVKGALGPFGLLAFVSKDLKEKTAIFYRIFKSHNNNNKYVVLMCSDQSRSSLNPDNDMTTYGAFVNVDPLYEKLSLRSLIDHSIVESFGGKGKACITARVYPTLAVDGDTHLYAFNYGSESVKIAGSAWSMKTAKIN